MDTPELEKVYAPHDVEERWSKKWVESGVSTAPEQAKGKNKFSL